MTPTGSGTPPTKVVTVKKTPAENEAEASSEDEAEAKSEAKPEGDAEPAAEKQEKNAAQ
jgi:hypothetical protein